MISPFDHPRLHVEGYTKTSESTIDYNCIAWALNDQNNWWWPGLDLTGKEAFWPREAPRKRSIRAFILAFKSRGFEPCKNGDLEIGYEKVALYTLNNLPTHAARQLPDGQWTHKMGRLIDLTSTLTAVEGPIYGKVARYLRRKLPKKPARS